MVSSIAIVSRGKVSIAMVSIATVSGAIVSVVVVGVEAATLLREHHVVIVPVADADDEGGHAVARQGEEEGLDRLAALLLGGVVLPQELQHRGLGEGAARTARILLRDVRGGVRVEHDLVSSSSSSQYTIVVVRIV